MTTRIKLWQALIAIVILIGLAAGGAYLAGQNRSLKRTLIQAGLEPELQVSEAALGRPDLITEKLTSTPRPEQDDYEIKVSFKNKGKSSASNFISVVLVDRHDGNGYTVYMDKSTENLLPGASEFVPFGLSDYDGNGLQIKACADYYGHVAESNESNNCTGPITVSQPQ